MARKLVVEIIADASHYTKGLESAERMTKSFAGTVQAATISVGTLAKSFAVFAVFDAAYRGLTDTVHAGIGEFKESTQIQAQTVAALKSTGDISGKTADQIHALSLSLSNLSGQSDESIQSAENVLLSFTNIRDSLGKNNDVFTRATKTVVDYAARTGKDAPAAAVLFGKALQDPAKRVGILARAGVVLTKSQTAYLKSVESSKGILAAQKILLQDLSVRFSGAAAAAGKTLPGALDILKERFRDLAGEGVGAVQKPLTDAANALAGFVVKLTDAHGATAKFHVLLGGLKDVATSAFDTLRAKIEQIDWGRLFRGATSIGRSLLDQIRQQLQRVDWGELARTIGDRIRSVDWAAVIKDAAHGLTVAVTTLLDTLTAALRKVNWEQVGKAIADGLAIAVGAVAKFVASIDWGKVIKALARGLLAAADAAGALFEGVAREIGRFILIGLQKAFTYVGKQLESVGLRLAIAILDPLSSIPRLLGGGVFQDLKKTLQGQLASLGTAGETFAQQAARQVAEGYVKGLQATQAQIVAAFQNVFAAMSGATAPALTSGAAIAAAAAGPAAADTPLRPAGADITTGDPTKGRKGITAAQRNTWFDNMISRLLDQAQDGSLQQQIAKLKAVGRLIQERIAATRDVTRRLTLEQELLDQVTRPIAAARQQLRQNQLDAAAKAQQNLFDRLQFNVDKAGLTAGLRDDLAALERYQSVVKHIIRTQGSTLALQQTLLGIEQNIATVQGQIAENRRKAAEEAAKRRDALQFRLLGLGPTGGELVPGIRNLKTRLGSIRDAVKGSFLDTAKTRAELKHIGQILAGQFGVVSEAVRAAIDKMYDDIRQKLKDRQGDQTRFRHLSSRAFVDSLGLNLTLAQRRRIEAQFATVGPGGTVPGVRSHQFNAGITIHGGLHVHGVQDVPGLENQIVKRAKSRPHTRRGD